MTRQRRETRDDAQDLYLYVREDRSHRYFHLDARVCAQRFEDHQFMPQGVDDDYSDAFKYNGLVLRCQGDQDSQTKPEAPVYGFDVTYRDIWTIDLRLAKRHLRTLAHIDARLDAIRDQRGYVKTYGEFVGRVAEALKCKGIGIERSREGQEMSGTRWDWRTIGEGVNSINGLIWNWQQERVRRDQDARDRIVAAQTPAETTETEAAS